MSYRKQPKQCQNHPKHAKNGGQTCMEGSSCSAGTVIARFRSFKPQRFKQTPEIWTVENLLYTYPVVVMKNTEWIMVKRRLKVRQSSGQSREQPLCHSAFGPPSKSLRFDFQLQLWYAEHLFRFLNALACISSTFYCQTFSAIMCLLPQTKHFPEKWFIAHSDFGVSA